MVQSPAAPPSLAGTSKLVGAPSVASEAQFFSWAPTTHAVILCWRALEFILVVGLGGFAGAITLAILGALGGLSMGACFGSILGLVPVVGVVGLSVMGSFLLGGGLGILGGFWVGGALGLLGGAAAGFYCWLCRCREIDEVQASWAAPAKQSVPHKEANVALSEASLALPAKQSLSQQEAEAVEELMESTSDFGSMLRQRARFGPRGWMLGERRGLASGSLGGS